MPPLPPKPKVPPMMTQALVVAALSTTACQATPPRIGQPPPHDVRIGAEQRPPEETLPADKEPPVRIGHEEVPADPVVATDPTVSASASASASGRPTAIPNVPVRIGARPVEEPRRKIPPRIGRRPPPNKPDGTKDL